MKKIVSLGAVAFLSVAAFAQTVINDPNVEKLAASGYHGVSISGNIELFLVQGNDESVAVSADEKKWRDKIVLPVQENSDEQNNLIKII
jgi:hypothetical protein